MMTTCGVAALVLSAMQPPAPDPGPQSIPLYCVRQDHEFTLSQVKSPYTALHFVADPAHPDCAAFIREYFDRWPEAAGVYHVFVVSLPRPAVDALAAEFKDESLMIAADESGRLAAELKVDRTAAATVVLQRGVEYSGAGTETLRHTGGDPHDNLRFASFSRQFESRSKAGALPHYNLPKGSTLALEGYDPVAYHTAGKATRGRPEFSTKYRGVSYRFATAENRRRFATDPDKYMPTYGGWCASAMGDKGTKVEVDPTNFKVKGGRLFLFYKSVFADALKDWNKREREWEPAADTNWKKLTGEDPAQPAR